MEISLLQCFFNKDKLQKSSSDLPKNAQKAWEWLISKSISIKHKKNLDKSQHKANLFENHILKPMKRISDMLPYFYRFDNEKLDEVFTAQTMRPLLMELLRNRKINEIFNFRNDIKTVELARLFTQIGLLLLQSNNTKQSVHDNINRVLQDYQEYMEQVKSSERGNDKNKVLTEKREMELISERIGLYQKKKKTKSDQHRIDEINSTLKKKFEHLKPIYCEFNYSNDFEQDMIKKYRRYGFKTPDENIVRIPHIEDLPKELRGAKMPRELVQYIKYEIEFQQKSLNTEIDYLNREVRKLRFAQQTGLKFE